MVNAIAAGDAVKSLQRKADVLTEVLFTTLGRDS